MVPYTPNKNLAWTLSILQMHGNSIVKLYQNMISQPHNKTPKRGNETLQHCNPLQNELKNCVSILLLPPPNKIRPIHK
jgi:hypothetical protein